MERPTLIVPAILFSVRWLLREARNLKIRIFACTASLEAAKGRLSRRTASERPTFKRQCAKRKALFRLRFIPQQLMALIGRVGDDCVVVSIVVDGLAAPIGIVN